MNLCSISGSFVLDIETEQEIFNEVLNGELDFSSDPWPNISESAKDLVAKMLDRDTKRRIKAHEVLSKDCLNLKSQFVFLSDLVMCIYISRP